ncbi:MAG: SUMF1/EgtB/PvdO family nonheme iron enzyme [Candidatus Anammoxibacter sp.]
MAENKHKPVYIISDEPQASSKLFGFDAYAKTLAELIANKDNKTPLVIGVYGPWGSGKTTLMQTVKTMLEDIGKKNDPAFRKCKSVWFQAWKYNDEDAILAALIEKIFKTMKSDGFFEMIKAGSSEFLNKFDKGKVFGKFSELLTGININDFFSKLEYKNKLGFYDTFQEFFDEALWTYINWRPKITASEEQDDKKGALVVFIDDLDRCPEDRIVKTLETIKLFMDKPGCVFVIGAAIEIIEKALEKSYKEDSDKFMDKIVQVTFNLPKIPENDFDAYIKEIHPGVRNDISEHMNLLVSSLGSNPRKLKRFLNNLSLQEGLFRNKGIDVEFNHLLYWSIIDYNYPSLRNSIKDRTDILGLLKKWIANKDKELGNEDWEVTTATVKDEKAPESFHEYITDRELVAIIRNFDVEIDKLRQLITFSSIVESADDAKLKQVKNSTTDFDKMVEVSDGEFLYGKEKRKETIEKPFQIDIYPVTNNQYKRFIDAGGYSNEKILLEHWSDEGRNWFAENNITLPRFWDNEKLNRPNCPVIGVSFYEAEAFAKWSGKRLPTEEEWEKAARGTNGRVFPWGDEFDKEKCNTGESDCGKSTDVTLYPDGISYYGCYDMAGNVWEWIDDRYNDGKDTHVLRGGSWINGTDSCRCDSRDWFNPGARVLFIGFRCVRTQKN